MLSAAVVRMVLLTCAQTAVLPSAFLKCVHSTQSGTAHINKCVCKMQSVRERITKRVNKVQSVTERIINVCTKCRVLGSA